MSDLNDIYFALMSARSAVQSLESWQRNADGYDSVRNHSSAIERGIAAYERVQRDMLDGRVKYTEHPESYERTSCGCGDPDASPPCSYCTRSIDDEAVK